MADKTDFNTSDVKFDIINPNTVKGIKKKINSAGDEAWIEKQLNSKLLQGILNGSDIDTISKSFLSVLGNNIASAIRNARTMTTESENGGRIDSYKELASQGVVQKKVWIATPDDRTRQSHIDLDGEEQDLDDEFSNGCMYPADPHGDDEEIWNCRCTMRSHIVGFKNSDGTISYVKGERGTTLHDKQMSEEKERRA